MPLVACSKEKPENLVLDFYNWYFSAIKAQTTDEYQPKIVADKNGMATLDVLQYVQNLRTHYFSEDLIDKEIAAYQECIKNLETIKYDTIGRAFSDIGDYSEKGCDFFNYYRWTLEMDPIDGVSIVDVTTLPGSKLIVKGRFYNFNDKTKEYSYWNKYCFVMLRQTNGMWKIENIDIKDD